MYYGIDKREDILAKLTEATVDTGSTPQNLLNAIHVLGLTGEIREGL
jgi:hypothetical protein